MVSRTSNQEWSKGLEAGYVLYTVTAELHTANVAYFQRKIQLSGLSAYPAGSPSQFIRVIGVELRNFGPSLLHLCTYSYWLFRTMQPAGDP